MKKLILALALAAPAAHANVYFDGNKLYAYLTAEEGSHKLSIAAGYVVGVVDAHSEQLCVPDNTTIQQLVDVVRKALRELPQVRHNHGDVIVKLSVAAAFPCKGGA